MDENYDELLSLITHGVEIEKKIARGNMNQFLDCLKLENALIFGSLSIWKHFLPWKQKKGWIFTDAAYYAIWLSIVYVLKDRLLENLLVFSSKIEDLTLLTLVCLQTKGKREKWLSFAPKPPVRKDKAYRWLFRRFRLQNGRQIHGFSDWLFSSFCALVGIVFCSVFDLGYFYFSQPKENVCRSDLTQSWRSHLFFSLC